MRALTTAVLPLLSVLLGAWITYVVNVRQRRRTKVEDIYHEAIETVAVAHAAHDYISALNPWRGASAEESAHFNSQIGREGLHNYVQAVASARAALARASAYDPTLSTYVNVRRDDEEEPIYARADQIMAHLRSNIEEPRSRSDIAMGQE